MEFILKGCMSSKTFLNKLIDLINKKDLFYFPGTIQNIGNIGKM